jgi:prepilin-type N-terminal cleavage/methylation domain-containing protein
MINKKQSGFTLVEIAIVLVVIGLLLGGILKGQQLINSARVRNLADQNSGVQAAYYGFVDRFRSLPGDMLPRAACDNVGAAVDPLCATLPVIGGNADGRILNVTEAAAVWAHLSAAGFLNGTYAGTTTTAALYRVGVPTGDIPPNAFQGPILLAHMDDYTNGNVGATVARLAYSFGGNIPVPLLRDLDQKVDDGVAGSGVMRVSVELGADTGLATFVGAATAPLVAWESDGTAANDCANLVPATAIWNVDSPNTSCNAVFLY